MLYNGHCVEINSGGGDCQQGGVEAIEHATMTRQDMA